MTTFYWILFSGIFMAAIALTGSITLILPEKLLQKILLPLVALAAGSLIGGSFFHLLPEAIEQMNNQLTVFVLAVAGFAVFMALEQFMHWHHCHKKLVHHKEPVTILILVADGLHNFIGGLAIGSVFIIDVRLGIAAWIAAAAHEVPQELGDFGVLVQGGWNKKKALLYNFLSGLTFLLGGLVVYFASSRFQVNTNYLVPFGAGNFLYIAASDLIPQINKGETIKKNLLHYFAFIAGILLLFFLR
ncbi:MAG TPA: ZIP family metal transporter [Chitinophagaceae bacterium]|nr:ZIP family metal transporter [Chitinophagaceae bacterium]